MQDERARRRRMPRATASAAAALAGAAVVLLAGCAQAVPPVGEPIPMPDAPRLTEVDCRSEPSSGMMFDPGPFDPGASPDPSIPVPGRVPAGFEASAALLCVVDWPPIEAVDPAPPSDQGDLGESGGPIEPVVRIERLQGDLTALLAALAAPDDAVPATIVCTADLELVPALWLEDDAGSVAPVHYPRDACGKTKPAVRDALAGLDVTATEVWIAP